MEEKTKKTKAKDVQVLKLSDALFKIGTELQGSNKVVAAAELICNENVFLGLFDRKGETYFIVKKKG